MRVHNLPKFNPVADWSEAEVREYRRATQVVVPSALSRATA
jgi:3'-phosphoadenosine 5'-phosphosulfate sulfotransferase (PAPS reductase)/FAD synthetase